MSRLDMLNFAESGSLVYDLPRSLQYSLAARLLARYARRIAFIFGFLAFLPYPAFSLGTSTGVQLGDLFSLVFAVPLVLLSTRRTPYYLLGVLVLPLCVACLKVAFVQGGQVDVSFKSTVSWLIFLNALLAAQLYLPGYFLEVGCGIATAMLLHDAVGFWQMYTFAADDELPLKWLYINPSFYGVQDNPEIRYIHRPFGLFPEPSAMSASLAPWVLLWIAELCGIIRFVRTPTNRQRALFTTAAVASVLLIIFSRSGHAMITLAVALVFGLVWLKRARATPRVYLAVTLIFGVAIPLTIYLLVQSVGERVTEMAGGNQSWQDRSYSLLLGFGLWIHGTLADLLLGVGPGLLSGMINARYGYEAVWSVVMVYIYESGLLGLAAVCWFGAFLWGIWRKTHWSLAYAGIFLTWLVGATVTTSYNQLLPLWVALGLFTVWPQCIETGREAPSAHRQFPQAR